MVWLHRLSSLQKSRASIPCFYPFPSSLISWLVRPSFPTPLGLPAAHKPSSMTGEQLVPPSLLPRQRQVTMSQTPSHPFCLFICIPLLPHTFPLHLHISSPGKVTYSLPILMHTTFQPIPGSLSPSLHHISGYTHTSFFRTLVISYSSVVSHIFYSIYLLYSPFLDKDKRTTTNPQTVAQTAGQMKNFLPFYSQISAV